MNELLIIIIIIAFLALILTFLLSFIVKKTNTLMKNVFVDRMSEFDFLLCDKERKVDELNADIEKKTKIITELEEKAKEYSNTEDIKKDDVIMPKFTDFEDGNVLYNYKVIKKEFNYDPSKVIKEFLLKNKTNEMKEYEVYKKIRSYFTFDVVYKISLYQPSEQYEIIKELLKDDDSKIVDELLNQKKFNLKKFVENIDMKIIKTNPIIRVLVGDEKSNFNDLDENIVTEYDSSITEGFKIIYKGVIYDYSI